MNSEQLKNAKNSFYFVLGLDMAVTAMTLIAEFVAINVLTDIRSGTREFTQSTIETIQVSGWFSKFTILTAIAVGISLVYWLGACYGYAKETLKTTGLMQEKWKTWGWIVPFMNIFKPYQVITEIYKVGAPDYAGSEEWKKLPGSNMLLGWWIFWVIAHVLSLGIVNRAIRVSTRDNLTLNQILEMGYVGVAACVISLIIASLWFVVAGHLTQRLLSRSGPFVVRSESVRPVAVNNVHEPAAISGTKLVATTSASIGGTIPPLDLNMIDEDAIYTGIENELETGSIDKGLWTRLFSEFDGDDSRTKAAYIKQRAAKLKASEQARISEITRQREEETARLEKIRLDTTLTEEQRVIELAPKGQCPCCNAVISMAYKVCPSCRADFTNPNGWKVLPIKNS